MNFDSDRFIIEIQNREAIWNVRCADYSNKLAKGKAWEEICQIFTNNFNDMSSAEKNKAACDLQRKWKSFRDSFRRELANKKKTKSGSGAQIGRKEYIYFQQLSFLLPVCETKPDELLNESHLQESSDKESVIATDEATATRPSSPKSKRKKTTSLSDERQLFKILATNIEQKAAVRKDDDDPDRHFLLSLLPHFKTLPDNMKLDVQIDFFSTLQKYKRAAMTATYPVAPVISHVSGYPVQYPQTQPISTSSYPVQYLETQPISTSSQYSHISQNNHQKFLNSEVRVFTELQPIPLPTSPSESNESQSQVPTPLSSSSPIHDDFF